MWRRISLKFPSEKSLVPSSQNHESGLSRSQQQNVFTEEIILQQVRQIRQRLPRVGTRKLQAHKLLIRQRKRKVYTTDSRHWMRKYANLSSQLIVERPEQLWVSDMTYIKIQNQWGYLSLITDAWSRKIMGYCLRSDMLAQGCVAAYNEIRPHGSCDYLTPNQAHQTLTPMKKRWKNYPRLGTEQEAGPAPLPEQGTASCSPSSKKQYLGPGRLLQP
jgi:transposase InsO family protein